MSEYGLGTEALPGSCGPSQSGRLQAGRLPLLLHRTRPRPPDRAIGPAGHSSYIVPGRGFSSAQDRTHRSTGTCWPSQSGRLQVGLPPLLLHRHGTGLLSQDRASGRRAVQVIQSAVTVPGGIGLSHRSTGAYVRSQSERLQAGRPPPLLRLLHHIRPPQDRAIGPAGHYTVRCHGPGQHHDQTHRSPGARGPSQSG